MKTVFCVAISAVLLAGCATRANSVAPMSISANEYATLACTESRAELQSARARQFALERRQNNAATADAASVFLFLLPLGSVFGADVAGELSQAKGEALALERHTRMACDNEAAAAPISYPEPAAGPIAAPAPVANRPARACGMIKQRDGSSRMVPC